MEKQPSNQWRSGDGSIQVAFRRCSGPEQLSHDPGDGSGSPSGGPAEMRAGQARHQISEPRRQEDHHRPGWREPALQLPRPEGFQHHHRRRRRHGARRVQVHRRAVRIQAGRLVRPAAGGDRRPGRRHVGQSLLHDRTRQAGRLRHLHDRRHRRPGRRRATRRRSPAWTTPAVSRRRPGWARSRRRRSATRARSARRPARRPSIS